MKRHELNELLHGFDAKFNPFQNLGPLQDITSLIHRAVLQDRAQELLDLLFPFYVEEQLRGVNRTTWQDGWADLVIFEIKLAIANKQRRSVTE